MSLRIETCLCCQADIWHFKNCQQASFVCTPSCAHIYHTATLLYNPSAIKVTLALTGWRKKQVFLISITNDSEEKAKNVYSRLQFNVQANLLLTVYRDCGLLLPDNCRYKNFTVFFSHLKKVNTVKHSYTALIFIFLWKVLFYCFFMIFPI